MEEKQIPLKTPGEEATYTSPEGVTVNEKAGGLVIVHDPEVEGIWSFSSRATVERIFNALDQWRRMTGNPAVRKEVKS